MSPGRRLATWGPLAAYAALLFFASSRTDLHLPESVWDKSVHFVSYGILAFLAVRAFHGGLRPLEWRRTWTAAILSVLYGAVDEFHQWFVPGRDANVGDLAADILGVSAGIVLTWLAVGGAGGARGAVREVTVLEVQEAEPPPGLEAWLRTAPELGLRVQRRRLSMEEMRRRFPGADPPLVFLDGRLMGCGAGVLENLRAIAGSGGAATAYNDLAPGPAPADTGRRRS